jgi:hypothetical protein
MHVQQKAVAKEEPLNGHQGQPTAGVNRERVVYDPDPYEHLTPAERYALAIQRRDALLTAGSRSSV